MNIKILGVRCASQPLQRGGGFVGDRELVVCGVNGGTVKSVVPSCQQSTTKVSGFSSAQKLGGRGGLN
jgi:hypothetical protein